MKSSSRSKKIAIASSFFFVLGLISLNFEGLGLLPIFIVVVSFFMTVVHGVLHFSGRKNGDVFETYQEAAKTKASALEVGLNSKVEKR
ncbi:hypothetical protein [Vibrio vulnificus]|uniref:hypothetical protein n=1 Tax=Vibrio vulnificus TaxID=672 RepID=UPI004059818C